MTKTILPALFIGMMTVILACSSDSSKDKGGKSAQKTKEQEKPKERLTFDSIKGIRYTEVKRRFSNGLSFNEIGFMQEPSWIIEFQSNDTVLAYSPVKLRMLPFFLMYDHGDVYNFAKEYFRIKKISKDSLVFQRLQVKKREIANDISSDVNMTFYANSYIEKTLKTTAEQLQKPSSADTAYIKKLTDKSNQDPGNSELAFAGRTPVQFTSTSHLLTVEKKSTMDQLSGRTESYDYLFPKYKIVITKAYTDFGYEMKVVVDAIGRMHLISFYNSRPEMEESRRKSIQAIIDVYLKNLMKTTPGATLGIPHSSELTIVIAGRKAKK